MLQVCPEHGGQVPGLLRREAADEIEGARLLDRRHGFIARQELLDEARAEFIGEKVEAILARFGGNIAGGLQRPEAGLRQAASRMQRLEPTVAVHLFLDPAQRQAGQAGEAFSHDIHVAQASGVDDERWREQIIVDEEGHSRRQVERCGAAEDFQRGCLLRIDHQFDSL